MQKNPTNFFYSNISSIYGIVSPEDKNYSNSNNVNPIHYGVSKSGMIQLSKYLACNLAEKYIRVNSISPGAVPNLKNKKKKNLVNLSQGYRWADLENHLK